MLWSNMKVGRTPGSRQIELGVSDNRTTSTHLKHCRLSVWLRNHVLFDVRYDVLLARNNPYLWWAREGNPKNVAFAALSKIRLPDHCWKMKGENDSNEKCHWSEVDEGGGTKNKLSTIPANKLLEFHSLHAKSLNPYNFSTRSGFWQPVTSSLPCQYWNQSIVVPSLLIPLIFPPFFCLANTI